MALIREAVRFVPGSPGLVAARWLVAIAASLPALVAVRPAADEAARAPYFTGAEPLSFVQAALLARELAPAAAFGLALAAALAFVADQVLTAGGLALLDPARPRPVPPRVVARAGLAHFWTMVRIAGWTLLLAGTGGAVLRWLVERAGRAGERAGWTAATLTLTLPLLTLLSVGAWAALAAACGFWARVIAIADARRRTRRAMLLALRVLARRPIATAGMFLALAVASTAVPVAIVVAWRGSPPAGTAGAWCWFLAASAAQLLPALAWHFGLRWGRLVYAVPRFDDLRDRPDEPLRWIRRTLARLRRAGARGDGVIKEP